MEFRRPNGIPRHGLHRSLLPLLAMALLVLARPLAAQEGVFTISGISVDVTDSSAEAARQKAVADGHRMAMRRLLERLLPTEELARAPELDAGQIGELVQDYSVENEKRSNVRYLANMVFRFKPEAVRDLLRGYGLTYSETQAPEILVLPVFGKGGSARLWEDPNPWWQAWSARPRGEGLVPLLTPLGDLGDIAAVDAGAALAPDRSRLAAVAERYNLTDVLVTQAILSGDPEAGQGLLEVVTTVYGPRARGPALQRYRQKEGEDYQALLKRAVTGEAAAVEQDWKQANLLQAGIRNIVAVSVWAPTLEIWMEIQRNLEAVAAVVSARTRLITRGVIQIDMEFLGEPEQLINRLARRDVVLTNDPLLGWVLYRNGAQPDPAGLERIRTTMIPPGATPFIQPGLGTPLPGQGFSGQGLPSGQGLEGSTVEPIPATGAAAPTQPQTTVTE